MKGFKVRSFPEENYRAIYCGGKTLRLALDPTKPIKNLTYPEFYDIKITPKCSGRCSYCYQSSEPEVEHYPNIVEKCRSFFEPLTFNQRPFQVALGGGNPNEHPEFISLLALFRNILDITPNYTTNGIGMTPEILAATRVHCGGVAVSCHEHLAAHWVLAAQHLIKWGIKTNFHIIISDKSSVDTFLQHFSYWQDKIAYFVLLPYSVQGRAQEKELAFDYLFDKLKTLPSLDQIAFGARFYEHLKKCSFPVSLYEPEIMSKFLDLKDMKVYGSSFET